MAKRGVKGGRTLVAYALLAFVVISAAVITRRSFGHEEGQRTRELQSRLAALESERIRLNALIRDASSRPQLEPVVEQQLGMHVPADTQVVILQRSTRASGTP